MVAIKWLPLNIKIPDKDVSNWLLCINLMRPTKGSLPTDLFSTRVEFCTKKKEIRQNKVAAYCLYKKGKQLL